MAEYYTVSEYAAINGKDPGNIRRMLIKGKLAGKKIGNLWAISKDAVYPTDGRVRTGNYRNWRKRSYIYRRNEELMTTLRKMCLDLSAVYAPYLDKIVLYGSFARGEETEESDVDIALLLATEETESMRDRMTDIVVDYEIDCGITLSVIAVSREHYMKWKDIMPFYKNLDKEGIVLWKAE